MTGLPKPQDEHATIMAQFASKMIHEFDDVVEELTEALGDDTAGLKLRVGCHSGPITAGVLRGGKDCHQFYFIITNYVKIFFESI